MRTTVFAALIQENKIVRIEELGKCNIDEGGRISARSYDKLKSVLAMSPKKGQHVSLMTAEGLFDTFGGSNAQSVKSFVVFAESDLIQDPFKLKGNAATRAKKKYNSAAYDRQEIVFPKGDREKYQRLVKEHGYDSIGDFVRKKLEELEQK